MVAIIFFPNGRPHLANYPHPPVRICPPLPDPPFPITCGHPLWMALYCKKYFLIKQNKNY